jgi:hypothetical protein
MFPFPSSYILDSQLLEATALERHTPMSVLHPRIEVMLANHFTGAIWAFPVYDIAQSSMTKTSNQNGTK